MTLRKTKKGKKCKTNFWDICLDTKKAFHCMFNTFIVILSLRINIFIQIKPIFSAELYFCIFNIKIKPVYVHITIKFR